METIAYKLARIVAFLKAMQSLGLITLSTDGFFSLGRARRDGKANDFFFVFPQLQPLAFWLVHILRAG